MSNLLQLYQGSKSYGPKDLFLKASFSINAGEHVGVIGPNGAGKSTLFKILIDEEHLDHGEITLSKNLRIGYLAQHDSWNESDSVEDYLTRGCRMPIWEMKALGSSLGLEDDLYARPIQSLSGGYRMRCKLLHLLGEEPDLLLLDEPTNYLDLESLLALEGFLQGYEKAFLLISHDREFLRRTTDHILEVEAGDITKYNGSLDDYFEQKALLQSQLAARALSVEDKRKEILDFVARFGAKASKARQAQSRLKSLDRLEKIEIKALPNTAEIHLPQPLHTGKLILSMDDVNLGYDNRTVLSNVTFQLNRGDHLAVVGVNGAGKSTFLKALAGKLSPLKGEVKYGYEVAVGYYAQHVSEALDPGRSVIEEMTALAHASVTRQQGLNLAGALLFSGDDTRKVISLLSGGEKSRVALGRILLGRAPCLILDEPTNHLDFQTVEALTVALMQYKGTVVVVSHDRSFIGRIGTKILEIRDGSANIYPGTYDEYVWSTQNGGMSNRNSDTKQKKPALKQTAAQPTTETSQEDQSHRREQRKHLEKQLRKSEGDLEKLERSLAEYQRQILSLNEKISTNYGNPSSNVWIDELGQVQTLLSECESKWFALSEGCTDLKKRLEMY